jgi:hypothetical protein
MESESGISMIPAVKHPVGSDRLRASFVRPEGHVNVPIWINGRRHPFHFRCRVNEQSLPLQCWAWRVPHWPGRPMYQRPPSRPTTSSSRSTLSPTARPREATSAIIGGGEQGSLSRSSCICCPKVQMPRVGWGSGVESLTRSKSGLHDLR